VVVNDAGTRPMVFGKSVNPSIQRPIMANDREDSSSSSTSKYFQPRWCPPRWTRTQRRKLQRLRAQVKTEQEFKRLRDRQFNHYRPENCLLYLCSGITVVFHPVTTTLAASLQAAASRWLGISPRQTIDHRILLLTYYCIDTTSPIQRPWL